MHKPLPIHQNYNKDTSKNKEWQQTTVFRSGEQNYTAGKKCYTSEHNCFSFLASKLTDRVRSYGGNACVLFFLLQALWAGYCPTLWLSEHTSKTHYYPDIENKMAPNLHTILHKKPSVCPSATLFVGTSKHIDRCTINNIFFSF